MCPLLTSVLPWCRVVTTPLRITPTADNPCRSTIHPQYEWRPHQTRALGEGPRALPKNPSLRDLIPANGNPWLFTVFVFVGVRPNEKSFRVTFSCGQLSSNNTHSNSNNDIHRQGRGYAQRGIQMNELCTELGMAKGIRLPQPCEILSAWNWTIKLSFNTKINIVSAAILAFLNINVVVSIHQIKKPTPIDASNWKSSIPIIID